jgi:hypothetical protein
MTHLNTGARPQHPIAQNIEGEARHYQKAATKPNQPQRLAESDRTAQAVAETAAALPRSRLGPLTRPDKLLG